MNKKILSVLILISGILISGGIIGSANAQTTAGDIQYPIPELGNCKSKSSCKVFCDDSKNSGACLAFAEQHNLMSPEEITAAKKFIDNGMIGPGGCKGQAECDQYCGNSTHLEECVTFAQKNGIMSDQQLQDSQKVLAAIKNGLKPPACSGPKQCDAYCGSSEHMEECMTFSLAAGIAPDNQKEQMQKTLDALKNGIKIPACHGQQECDKYCGTHMEECITFSLAAGMVPDNQKEQVQKTLNVIKQGIKPPACQPKQPDESNQPNQPNQPGQTNQPEQPNQQNQNQPAGQVNQPSQSGQNLQACDQYCADPGHVEECVKFSVAMGNMTEQQGQNSIKNGNKGPGGCIGRDACDTFCNNPDNQETCFNFGKENGMIPQEDLQRMQEGQQKMKDSFSQIPQEVLDCLTSSLGADVVEKMKNGSFVPQKAGDSINQCFQKAPQGKMPNQNQPNQQNQNQQGQPGNKFQPGPGTVNPGGQQMPQQAGPGGCKGPEECQKYCSSNPEECKNFQPQQKQGQPGQNQQQNQNGQNQPNQPGQMQPGQNQPGQFIQGQPGEPGQFIQGQQPNQPGQMQPQQQMQPPVQQQNPAPSSSLQGKQGFLANILNALRR